MRRDYAGGAQAAQLTQSLGNSTADLTIYCTDLTGWPTGTGSKPFYVVIDRGTASEEKILCASRSGNVLTVFDNGVVNGRASDDTSITSHSTNAVIEHVFTATDADEANAHVNATGAVHGLSGSIVGTTDTQTLTNKTMSGASNTFSNIPAAAVVGLATDYATLTTAQTLTNKTLTAPVITPATNTQPSSYMLVLSDASKVIEMSGGGTLTIPTHTTAPFPLGTEITVLQTGTSQVTIAGGIGLGNSVTVNSAGGYLKMASQWSAVVLRKRAENVWVAIGALVA